MLNKRCRVVKLLGRGFYGAVYRTWDMNLERLRALKENLDTSPEAQRRFKQETQGSILKAMGLKPHWCYYRKGGARSIAGNQPRS